MKRLIIASAVLTVLVGCSTTTPQVAKEIPSPTPAVVKDQPIAAAGKVESPTTIDLPNWYIKPPASTDEYIFFSGTGYSSDLSMSREKALLDSQMKLADTLNGAMNAMIKQQKSDSTGSVISDKTSITVKKVIANTVMTGYMIEDTKILSENRNYRTFILVRYPIGDANRLLKAQLQQKQSTNSSSDDSLQKELDKEVEARSDARPASKTSSIAHVDLIASDNPEYVQRRAEALQKPGAIVMRETLR